jgi:hypothetical protein
MHERKRERMNAEGGRQTNMGASWTGAVVLVHDINICIDINVATKQVSLLL